MLLSLLVKNLALIEEAEVEFKDGLNILTGETGAGKSIIIGSVNAALGGKVSKEMIRSGKEQAYIELVFSIDNDYQKKQLELLDITLDDSQLIISRKITKTRSVSKVNGETVTAAFLKKIAEIVIDIHGQHEHQSLLNKHKHLQILDEFAKEELDKPKKKMSQLYEQYVNITNELENMDSDKNSRDRELSFLQYELQEITDAELEAGEDIKLELSYKRMLNSQKINDTIGVISNMLAESDSVCAAQLIGSSVRELSAIVAYDEELTSLNEQLLSIESLLNDFNMELSSYIQDLEFDEEDFHIVTERLDIINHLKSKYGNTISDILKAADEKSSRCKQLIDYEENLQRKKEELDQCVSQMTKTALSITKIRKKHGAKLAKEIKNTLLDMNFADVQFDMVFNQKKTFSALGIDDAEFLISTNPGEEMLPLGKVASGGELSRIMLAIKTVLANKDFVETMIFDEIDVGISGRTAQKISEKLGMLSKNKQIICITHLPQIAAMSDCHFVIEKKVENNGTSTILKELSEDNIYMELARLLGGAKITDAVLENAREMRELAKTAKI